LTDNSRISDESPECNSYVTTIFTRNNCVFRCVNTAWDTHVILRVRRARKNPREEERKLGSYYYVIIPGKNGKINLNCVVVS